MTKAEPESVYLAQPVNQDGVQAVLLNSNTSYCVDFLVKKSQTLSSDQWVWRQFAFRGQQLDVFEGKEAIESLSTKECDILEVSDNMYQLVRNGQPSFVFFTPCSSSRKTFLEIFNESKSTSEWTKPTSTLFEKLVGVANRVLEVDAAIKSSPIKTPKVPTASVTEAQVKKYVAELCQEYENLPTFSTKEELYQHVKQIVQEYAANPSKDSLVGRVLRLYPDALTRQADSSTRGLTTQLDVTQCPHCQKPFILTAQMNLHVGGRTLICDRCDNWVHYETFKLREMLQQITSFDFKIGIPMFQTKRSLPMPDIPRDGKAKTYMHRLWRIVFEDECNVTHRRVPYSAKFDLEERMMEILNRVDVVQVVYRYFLFASQIAIHATYWNNPKVLEAAVHRYNKFRYIAIRPKAPALAATMDILLVAHAHQLQSSTPVLPIDMGSDNIDVRLGDTAFLWGQHFNEPYSSCAMDLEAWIATKKGNEEVQMRAFRRQWAKYCLTPSFDCRFVGVEEIYSIQSIEHVQDLESEGQSLSLSVIGALETSESITRGKFRNLLTQDASRVYTYRYEREVRSLFEKILAPGWY